MADIEIDNEQIKKLVVDAVNAAKALMSYVDKHPNKIGDLKKEFITKLDRSIKMRLIQMLF